MYVCLCNNVTDRDIYRAVDQGARTMEHLRADLAVSTCCGRCEDCARKTLHQALSEITIPAAAFCPAAA